MLVFCYGAPFGHGDPVSLEPPCCAVFEGFHAQVAALAERNRHLERRASEAVVEGLRNRVASLTEQNRRLEHLLRDLRRAMYAKKSEKLHPDQLQLAFEALKGAFVETQVPASTASAPRVKHPDVHGEKLHEPDQYDPDVCGEKQCQCRAVKHHRQLRTSGNGSRICRRIGVTSAGRTFMPFISSGWRIVTSSGMRRR